jgi:hypothetical protein
VGFASSMTASSPVWPSDVFHGMSHRSDQLLHQVPHILPSLSSTCPPPSPLPQVPDQEGLAPEELGAQLSLATEAALTESAAATGWHAVVTSRALHHGCVHLLLTVQVSGDHPAAAADVAAVAQSATLLLSPGGTVTVRTPGAATPAGPGDQGGSVSPSSSAARCASPGPAGCAVCSPDDRLGPQEQLLQQQLQQRTLQQLLQRGTHDPKVSVQWLSGVQGGQTLRAGAVQHPCLLPHPVCLACADSSTPGSQAAASESQGDISEQQHRQVVLHMGAGQAGSLALSGSAAGSLQVLAVHGAHLEWVAVVSELSGLTEEQPGSTAAAAGTGSSTEAPETQAQPAAVSGRISSEGLNVLSGASSGTSSLPLATMASGSSSTSLSASAATSTATSTSRRPSSSSEATQATLLLSAPAGPSSLHLHLLPPQDAALPEGQRDQPLATLLLLALPPAAVAEVQQLYSGMVQECRLAVLPASKLAPQHSSSQGSLASAAAGSTAGVESGTEAGEPGSGGASEADVQLRLAAGCDAGALEAYWGHYIPFACAWVPLLCPELWEQALEQDMQEVEALEQQQARLQRTAAAAAGLAGGGGPATVHGRQLAAEDASSSSGLLAGISAGLGRRGTWPGAGASEHHSDIERQASSPVDELLGLLGEMGSVGGSTHQGAPGLEASGPTTTAAAEQLQGQVPATADEPAGAGAGGSTAAAGASSGRYQQLRAEMRNLLVFMLDMGMQACLSVALDSLSKAGRLEQLLYDSPALAARLQAEALCLQPLAASEAAVASTSATAAAAAAGPVSATFGSPVSTAEESSGLASAASISLQQAASFGSTFSLPADAPKEADEKWEASFHTPAVGRAAAVPMPATARLAATLTSRSQQAATSNAALHAPQHSGSSVCGEDMHGSGSSVSMDSSAEVASAQHSSDRLPVASWRSPVTGFHPPALEERFLIFKNSNNMMADVAGAVLMWLVVPLYIRQLSVPSGTTEGILLHKPGLWLSVASALLFTAPPFILLAAGKEWYVQHREGLSVGFGLASRLLMAAANVASWWMLWDVWDGTGAWRNRRLLPTSAWLYAVVHPTAQQLRLWRSLSLDAVNMLGLGFYAALKLHGMVPGVAVALTAAAVSAGICYGLDLRCRCMFVGHLQKQQKEQ